MSQWLSFTIIGIVTGSVYAVAASGLVVTYATSGIFNIAHGAIGMLMAFTYWELKVDHHWPTWLAFLFVVLVVAPVFGALVERFLVRGLRGASVGTSLVVTVGLTVGLMGLAQSLWKPTVARTIPQFFGLRGVHVGGVFLYWHNLITIVAGAAVALFLWLFLTRTRTGIAMRAVVDDRNLMSLTGARPDRLSMVSWAMGASLAATAGILIAPVLQLDVIILTLLVVNAYAAAVVGKLKSLPLTFAGALALGLIESYAVGYLNLQGDLAGLRPSLPTLFLFAVLLLMPEARLRAGRLGGVVSPRVPGRGRAALGAAALVVAAAVLSGGLSDANIARVGGGLALGLIMLSLVPLTGYGGQVSLCQMTFAGLGAFAMGKFAANGSVVGLIVAVVLASAVGALVALPAIRLQGLYLALATMAFAVLMDNMFFTNHQVFGNFGSLGVPRLQLPGLSFEGERAYFILLAVAFGLMGMFVLALRRGEFGRVLSAMRDSPVACATLGLDLTRTKLAIFMISAGMAGLAGALYGGLQASVTGVDFYMFQSLPLLLLAVVGGITTVTGALIGGVVFALLPVLQDRVPAVGGLVFLLVGIGAVSLGRNPNGLAYFAAERLRALWPGRGAQPQPLTGQDSRLTEEVPVAAPAG